MKAELCHATLCCVKDYAIQKPLLQLNRVLMELFQNKCRIFSTKIELLAHVALEGSEQEVKHTGIKVVTKCNQALQFVPGPQET